MEMDQTVMMAGVREGELYILESVDLVTKLDFLARARHIPMNNLVAQQRVALMLGYAAWAIEQAADYGLATPILA